MEKCDLSLSITVPDYYMWSCPGGTRTFWFAVWHMDLLNQLLSLLLYFLSLSLYIKNNHKSNMNVIFTFTNNQFFPVTKISWSTNMSSHAKWTLKNRYVLKTGVNRLALGVWAVADFTAAQPIWVGPTLIASKKRVCCNPFQIQIKSIRFVDCVSCNILKYLFRKYLKLTCWWLIWVILVGGTKNFPT